MRVATYSQPALVSRGSFVAQLILVLTILLGSSALHTVMLHFMPQLHRVLPMLWLVIYFAAFLGLMFNHGINWISWITRYRILLVILLLGTAISVSWSLDATTSAERTVHLLGSSIIAMYLGFMVPLLTILRVFAVVLAGILLVSIVTALAMPEFGLEHYEAQTVWRGTLNSKNALGFWAAVGVLLYITLSDSVESLFVKFVCYVMAILSLGVLVMSHSATSMLALLVAGALSSYIYIAMRFQLGFIRMAVMAVLFAGLVGFALTFIDTAELVGRTDDLTGRGEVWRQTWKLIMQRPVTGYGYGSLWFPNDNTIWIQQSLTDFTWVVYHAHNGFLQVASEIGLPLSCVALLMVAQQLIEIFYCQYERQQVGVLFVLAFVMAYLISNFSEARFLVNRELYWIFFLALPISMLRQINVVSSDASSEEGNMRGSDNAYRYPSTSGSGGPVAGKPWLNTPAYVGAAEVQDVPLISYENPLDFDFALHDGGETALADHTLDLSRDVSAESDGFQLHDHTLDGSIVELDQSTEWRDDEQDRYDISIDNIDDITGDWVDIPLGDD